MNLTDTIVETTTKPTFSEAMDTTITETTPTIDLANKYVFMEDTIEGLELAFGQNLEDPKRNIVLYGRGGKYIC
jgi:hypothetical protein